MDAFIRPARPSDKAPLMSFIKDVWGGHDYIPSVWDDWIRDARNKMFVVEVGGVPVGMNRIRFLEDGSAWFEGVRVHPDYRGHGLATLLGQSSMKVAGERGIKVFRLTSSSRNRTAHRQIARIRFREVSRFSAYRPGKSHIQRDAATVMHPSELRGVLRMVRGTREYRLGHGFFWHDWGAASLISRAVGILLDEGAVRRLGSAIAVTRAGGRGRRSWQEVCFVGGPPDDAVRLIQSITSRNRAADRWVFVPQGSPIIRALRGAGFSRGYSIILFERRAAKD